MSTIYPVPGGYPKEITGYAEPWIASPGEQVGIKVSCTEPQYRHRVVRITQGYEGPNSPPKATHHINTIPSGVKPGRFQLAHPGSYALIPDSGLAHNDDGIKLSLYVQPWLTKCDHAQTLVSNLQVSSATGLSLVIDHSGIVQLWIGTGSKIQTVSAGYCLSRRRWYHIELLIVGRSVNLDVTSLVEGTAPAGKSQSICCELSDYFIPRSPTPLLLAASHAQTTATSHLHGVPCNHFNGRLADFVLEAKGPMSRIVLKLDFSVSISSDVIYDVSGNSRNGCLINAPTRAVKSHDWAGHEVDWTKDSHGYGAIHFHEDDLDDAEWSTDMTICVPSNARSGVYVVEIESTTSDVRDTIPFFVRPTPSATAKIGARVALVASTFTYLAYANEHMFDQSSPARAEVPDEFGSFDFWKDEDYYKQERRKDLGLSCYDVHRDHSGVVFSSAKRPLLNHRLGYVNWTGHRPRELSAELIMIGFLERLGIAYDVLTDHDLHAKGSQCLQSYRVAITGCHPEYPSLESYTAYEDFLKAGGSLMYLGGNGFYWSSAMDVKALHRLEVRRGGQGVRTSWQDPGERHHQTDGKVGGLWRDRGKAANYLVGIGCCGEGAGPGVPYRMTPSLPQTHPDIAAWVFAGLDIKPAQDFVFGRNALGAFKGGASADEIDRMDFKYGSPRNIVVLASSTGHSDRFGLFPEDVGFPMMKTLGSQTDLIRSDMTYYETGRGGAVFSVGSISWYCALGWNDYKNDIAQITGNVLRKFLEGPKDSSQPTTSKL
ncbi:N,N-dimethylformamidase beta subunit [Pseudocercospora fuligena]|uniref:N,N-dimethylformamidase beta subunit n=1 Tax=Pseudocercospora fuligena TaxID=685502 RepID=A0A8H6RSY5_9PEZI|nr:N,N-dimethylformamidase beta subunit [Pseudocercospora fuligena]